MNTASETKFPEIEVTTEFKVALDIITEGAPFVFITGRAGTGKSTFTDLLKKQLQSYAIVAPTGVAALNVGGQTIHSFFRLAPGPMDSSKIKRVHNRKAYKALRTLIIDEISMVRADLLDAIDGMLRLNGPTSTRPFGGVQIIAIGDLYQLPPIISKSDEQFFTEHEYQSPFFFSAKALKEVPLKTVEFSKVFRQTETSFISLLNNIREGQYLEHTLPVLNERVMPLNANSFNGIVLSGTNDRAARINSQKLAEIPTPLRSYSAQVSGEFRVDLTKLPAPFELQLKCGAQVMFLKNDRSRRWVNGSLGRVTELGPDYVEVELAESTCAERVRVETDKWENFKFEFSEKENAVVATNVGSYNQIPLSLAWAVTIHKSQGKTFDRVHLDLGRGAFAEGQVYVGLSRCRTLEGVTLERAIRKEDIYLNLDVINAMPLLLQNPSALSGRAEQIRLVLD